MFTAEQLANARRVAGYVRGRGLPFRAVLITVLAAFLESSMRVLPYGDRTVSGEPAYGDLLAIPPGQPSSSRGLFQQQRTWVPAPIVGTDHDPRMSVEASTELFLSGGHNGQRGLLGNDWPPGEVWEAVQRIQRSEWDGRPGMPFGDNYRRALPTAHELLVQIGEAVSAEDRIRQAVEIVRANGGTVFELEGCWGGGTRDSDGNPRRWAVGEPVGVVDHHFVTNSRDPEDGRRLAEMLRVGYSTGSGRNTGPFVTNAFTDVLGRHYLIGTQPCSHAGTGNATVLARVRADEMPSGPAQSDGEISGNPWLFGFETQHPGDDSDYPEALLDGLVLFNAALCIAFGWSARRVIMHYVWTARKPDMSWRSGRDGDGWQEIIRRVESKIQEITEEEEEDMPSADEVADAVVRRLLNRSDAIVDVDGADGPLDPASFVTHFARQSRILQDISAKVSKLGDPREDVSLANQVAKSVKAAIADALDEALRRNR